jgi:hypothetical protein
MLLVAMGAGALVWNAPAGAGCSIRSRSVAPGDTSLLGSSLQIDVSSMRPRNGEIVVARIPDAEVPLVTGTIRGSVMSRAECSSRVAPLVHLALVPRGTGASITVGGGPLPVEVTKGGRVVGRLSADASPGTTLRLRW